MTNREAKLELAKVAIGAGVSLETTKSFYEWIIGNDEVEERKTEYDNIPIEKFASRTFSPNVIRKRCWENGINTVGDLLRCGRPTFLSFRNVGKTIVQRIDMALAAQYNILNW